MATVVVARRILKQALLATECTSPAEALGLDATGIGALYDDEVHRRLKLVPNQGQVVYHFAIGYPSRSASLGSSVPQKTTY
jgi:hypothetical protein